MGSSEFAVPSLEQMVAAGHDLALVVTQPPRRRRRRGKLETTAVGRAAERLGLSLFAPESIRDPDAVARLQGIAADVAVVAAYGQFLPKSVLTWPRLGCLNVHGSLLPAWRGAAPINRAIAAGDRLVGVTIIRLVSKMDAGPMLSRREFELAGHETCGEVEERLAVVGAECLLEVLRVSESGELPELLEQDEAQATYAPLIQKSESLVPWGEESSVVVRHVRAMTPRPGAWSWLIRAGEPTPRRVVVAAVAALEGDFGHAAEAPGMVLQAEAAGVVVATGGGGVVALREVVPAGGRRMLAVDWVRGRGVSKGDRFGDVADPAAQG